MSQGTQFCKKEISINIQLYIPHQKSLMLRLRNSEPKQQQQKKPWEKKKSPPRCEGFDLSSNITILANQI